MYVYIYIYKRIPPSILSLANPQFMINKETDNNNKATTRR